MNCVLVIADEVKKNPKVAGEVIFQQELVDSLQDYQKHLTTFYDQHRQPTGKDYQDLKDFNFPIEFLEIVNMKTAQFSYGNNMLARPRLAAETQPNTFYLEFRFYHKEFLHKFHPESSHGYLCVIEKHAGQSNEEAAGQVLF